MTRCFFHILTHIFSFQRSLPWLSYFKLWFPYLTNSPSVLFLKNTYHNLLCYIFCLFVFISPLNMAIGKGFLRFYSPVCHWHIKSCLAHSSPSINTELMNFSITFIIVINLGCKSFSLLTLKGLLHHHLVSSIINVTYNVSLILLL